MNELSLMSEALKQSLGLKYNPISVRFSATLPKNISRKPDGAFYRDAACTALCRSLKKGSVLVVASKKNCGPAVPQSCSGANFFLKFEDVSTEDAQGVYVKNEQVFCSEKVCLDFLASVPLLPEPKRDKIIVLSPLEKETDNPDVVIVLATVAQASRLIGLSVYEGFEAISVLPAISTCVSIYAPLTDGKIHINFIDYYDRGHQGKQSDGKLIWEEGEMLVSMPFSTFQKIVENISKSPHGDFKPDLKPRPFDNIF